MIRKRRPTTPGSRGLVVTTFSDVTKRSSKTGKRIKPTKSLVSGKRRISGRNNQGRISCRHKGGGHKRRYREIDFTRNKDGIPAKVASIEYDPNRSAYIALLFYQDGEKRYILAPAGLKEGDRVQSGLDAPFKPGCSMALKNMPLGSVVHNIELYPNRGGQLVRSAGLSAQLMARSGGYVTLKMPSGEVRLIHEECRATFGKVSKPEHSLQTVGKAGRSRWRGIRPTVRGMAMNPVDHPHGGGEGRGKGNIPQTPWAEYTRGKRTRSNKRSQRYLVKDRRK